MEQTGAQPPAGCCFLTGPSSALQPVDEAGSSMGSRQAAAHLVRTTRSHLPNFASIIEQAGAGAPALSRQRPTFSGCSSTAGPCLPATTFSKNSLKGLVGL